VSTVKNYSLQPSEEVEFEKDSYYYKLKVVTKIK